MPDTIDGSVLLDELTYCLEQGYPANITDIMLRTCDDRDNLWEAVDEWRRWRGCVDSDFTCAIYDLTCEDVKTCFCCDEWTWEDNMSTIHVRQGEKLVCDSCHNDYMICPCCGYHVHVEDTTGIHDGNSVVCDICVAHEYRYCEQCEDYIYRADFAVHQSECHGGCECEPHNWRFSFPNNGNGTVDNDDIFTVELPGGVISEVGKGAILEILACDYSLYRISERVFDEIGMEWQNRRGNFTRRFSSAMFKRGHKVPGNLLTEIGNVARAHSSNGSAWDIQLSRARLNESAGYWFNECSCWWGSEGESRCAFKMWGGIGMRSLALTTGSGCPSGRAWIQPINGDGEPISDIDVAAGFVVYNGYGELDGYHGARIVAHLTGNTYCKVVLRSEQQYINGNKGYLVATEEMCQRVEVIEWDHAVHTRR